MEESWEELRKRWDELQNGGLEKIQKQRLLEACRKVAARRHAGVLLKA